MPSDLPRPKPTTTTTETLGFRSCPLCEATCGLTIGRRHDEDGASHWLIRGDHDDPFSRGFLCPKGTALGALQDDPDRLRQPVRRIGDDPATARYEPIGWDEAFAEIDARLSEIIATHGAGAIGAYLGNPVVHSHETSLFASNLARALSSPHLYSASTVDQMAKHVSSGLLFGDPDAIPVPDLDRTDYLLMLGANPLESNGSLCTAPDFPGRLRALVDRGGQLVVVDPRRTKTAQLATRHLSIVPGTDALLLAAIAHHIISTDRCPTEVKASYDAELAALAELLAPFAPSTVVEATGIDAATIEEIAEAFATAESAVAYSRVGAHTTIFGTVASWLTDVVTIITGNLDRAGGAMFPTPLHLRVGNGSGRGFRTGRWTSRVKGSPEVRGEMPVAELAGEITTPGEGQLRALIVVAGNPVLSTPAAAVLDASLSELDFMVSVDPWLNETSRRADIILPPPSALQRSHYDLGFTRLSVRNVAKWTPALVDAGDHPPEWWILATLAGIVAGLGPESGDLVAEAMVVGASERFAPAVGTDAETLRQAVDRADRTPADQILDLMIRGARRRDLTLDDVAAEPHGIDFGALEPALAEALRTPDGRIDLVPDPMRAELVRLHTALGGGFSHELVLVGRRDLRSNNSWLHNVSILMRGKDRCTLQLHPDDAAARNISDGADVTITSAAGSVVAPATITDAIRPGVVSLPHGYGHDLAGVELHVASHRPGANSNVLTDGRQVDPLCGTTQLNAIPVTVNPR